MNVKSITVCVGYDDLLAVTLPRNIKHFSSYLVVTSLDDHRTADLVKEMPNVNLYKTDAFTRHGARFNKGLALEEAFDVVGRDGWISVWDADIILPDSLNLDQDLDPAKLYSMRRRVLNDVRLYHPGLPWSVAQIHMDKLFPGYFHLFNAAAPALSQQPWYDVTFAHAGGGDGAFQDRWRPEDKIRLAGECLHLGPIDTNWMGRCSDRLDGKLVEGSEDNRSVMENYVRHKGWRRSAQPAQPIQEHVEVPGYSPTGFKVGGKD